MVRSHPAGDVIGKYIYSCIHAMHIARHTKNAGFEGRKREAIQRRGKREREIMGPLNDITCRRRE